MSDKFSIGHLIIHDSYRRSRKENSLNLKSALLALWSSPLSIKEQAHLLLLTSAEGKGEEAKQMAVSILTKFPNYFHEYEVPVRPHYISVTKKVAQIQISTSIPHSHSVFKIFNINLPAAVMTSLVMKDVIKRINENSISYFENFFLSLHSSLIFLVNYHCLFSALPTKITFISH